MSQFNNNWTNPNDPNAGINKGKQFDSSSAMFADDVNKIVNNISHLHQTTPIERGGTNATNAQQARSNLGVTPENIGAARASHNHPISEITGLGQAMQVVDNLNSTSAENPLSANQGRILNERIQNSNSVATHIVSQNISPPIGTGRVDFITRVNAASRTQSYVLAIQLSRNENPHSGNVRVQLNKNFTVPSFSPIAVWGRRRSIVAFYGRSCMTTIFNAPTSIADALDTSSFVPMGFVELFPNGELVFTPNNHTGNGNAFTNQVSTSRFLRTSMILQDLYYEEAP